VNLLLTKTFSVAAIEHGTVIDHIKAGQGLKILQILKLAKHQKQVILSLNLPSTLLGIKDLIKVEHKELSVDEANQIALISPKATVSIIKNFEVAAKFQVELPQSFHGILTCQNPCCITHVEPIKSQFHIIRKGAHPKIQCHFCKKYFQGHS
jgi:aspartate carbamoyltransferase regulatory subunit